MIIQCAKCGTQFRVDDAKIGPTGAKVRCSKCSHQFVAGAAKATPELPPPPGPAAKKPADISLELDVDTAPPPRTSAGDFDTSSLDLDATNIGPPPSFALPTPGKPAAPA